MKYFIVSYSFSDGNGTVSIQDSVYPNYEELLERVQQENVRITSISIIGILMVTKKEYIRFYSTKDSR